MLGKDFVLRPYQTIWMTLPNMPGFYKEEPKHRPIIILDPGYDEDELDRGEVDLDAMFPYLLYCTGEVNTYYYPTPMSAPGGEPSTFLIPGNVCRNFGMKKETCCIPLWIVGRSTFSAAYLLSVPDGEFTKRLSLQDAQYIEKNVNWAATHPAYSDHLKFKAFEEKYKIFAIPASEIYAKDAEYEKTKKAKEEAAKKASIDKSDNNTQVKADESLSNNNWKNNLLNILKTKFKPIESIPIRSFLLPDGSFIESPLGSYDEKVFNGPHYNIDNWIGNTVFNYLGKHKSSFDEKDKIDFNKKYNVDETIIQNIYDEVEKFDGWSNVGGMDGSKLLEEHLGCIRLNGGVADEMTAVSIPSTKITEIQYDKLTSWLDKYYTDKVEVNVREDYESQIYHLDETIVDDVIKKIKRYYTTGTLVENLTPITKQILLEATRQQLINKSKNADSYARSNQDKGKNRFERRTKSSIATTVQDYNRIDMNTFWKQDKLNFGVRVHGETNNYVVTIRFDNILKELQREIKDNKGKLEFRLIIRALTRSFNTDNVYVGCTCDDFKYRQQYWATKGNYNSVDPQPSNGKKIANPNDSKGAGCKHILLVLANLEWIMKIASVINNYIYYCKDNMENNYGQFIFPKLYGMPYDKAIQLTLTDYDSQGELNPNLKSDEDIINMSNMIGRRRTQYKKKPQISVNPRFQKPAKPKPEHNELGLQFNNIKKEPKIEEEGGDANR